MFKKKSKTEEIIKKFGGKQTNTGTPEVQVALLTDRIQGLTGHVSTNKKDFSSRKGLLGLVSQRRQMLSYLKQKDEKRYIDLVEKLGLRK